MRLNDILLTLAMGLPAAGAAEESAAAPPPGDRKVTLRAWLGGTEPGTSKNAFEGQASYRSGDLLELTGGGSWTNNIFYTAYKGFAEGSWFYAEHSSLRGAFTFRSYDYTGADRPTPDSSAYKTVPRPEVEISHWFGRVRASLDYQLFAPNFQYDPGTRIVNHKLAGDLEVRLVGGLKASLMAALLRDPSPGRTRIKGRRLPAGMAPDRAGSSPDVVCVPAAPPAVLADVYCAGQTRVVARTELLFGGGLAYQSAPWGASVRYIPNRDLDSGFDWSLVSSVDLRPLERLSFNLAWIHDRYAAVAGPDFAGKSGNIYWATGRYQLTPGLAAAAGLKWVQNPGPASTAANPPRRNDGTLLLQLEYQTAAF